MTVIVALAAERVDEVHALRVELHRHHAAITTPPGWVPRDEEDAWRSWRARAAPLLHEGVAALFVHRASAAAEPDGMALVTMLPAAELARPVLGATGEHAELLTLVVRARARSAGIGAALYEAAAGWARDRGAVVMHVDTRAGNVDGLRFYERQGARPAFTQLMQPL
ncbi:Acetyltransferase (GNAT) family protein [Jatrophihabitans endophyticus]|uniref:Acetyltransferase (GNAT) family protein n=1 Tax=Jatrophihabitans endophyticus TaxID=1206085 RepID=A0A1M5KTV1_9ACTN|nr:GNAT family N-acetyltransferase [Jatrophihabitans endophyticus]SHG56166.1 Acetyltransferase (GNAT) family protein [Jatrophihabitans endophyticus]